MDQQICESCLFYQNVGHGDLHQSSSGVKPSSTHWARKELQWLGKLKPLLEKDMVNSNSLNRQPPLRQMT